MKQQYKDVLKEIEAHEKLLCEEFNNNLKKCDDEQSREQLPSRNWWGKGSRN